MAEKIKCEYCEKDAIGFQGFGCCFAYVCLDHADNFVRSLKPGKNWRPVNVTLSALRSRINRHRSFLTHYFVDFPAGV